MPKLFKKHQSDINDLCNQLLQSTHNDLIGVLLRHEQNRPEREERLRRRWKKLNDMFEEVGL